MRVLGKTIDDAIGEAYDKAAVILRIGYPGGPKLDRIAQSGNPSKADLPRSLLGPESLDFSFSGLKTALLYKVRGHPVGRGEAAVFQRSAADLSDEQQADLAASFQHAAVDSVILKLGRVIDQLTASGRPPRGVILGGGVSANSLLRVRVQELGQKRALAVHLPKMAYCVDNAAMIAGLAFHLLKDGRVDDLDLPVIATTSLG
jgi:N6-L-threonylcarbamoyladenine synthase